MRARHIRLVLSLAIATGLTTSPFAPSSAATLPDTVVHATAKLAKKLRVDMDGDGRLDTVRLYTSGKSYQVKVTNARKRTATYRGKLKQTGLDWYWGFKAAALDGAAGAEVMLQTDCTEECAVYRMLTWRKGRLVVEKSPEGRTTWSVGGPAGEINDYYFSESGGQHYTDHVVGSETAEDCEADVTRWVWSSTKWTKQQATRVLLDCDTFVARYADDVNWVH